MRTIAPARLSAAAAWLAAATIAALTATSADASGWKRLEGAWARVLDHADGTRTESKQDVRTRVLEELTYDKHDVLVKKRVFELDDFGRPQRGLIFDGNRTLLGRSEYLYDNYDELKEERLFDARGRLIRRLIYRQEGGIRQRPVAFTYDPDNPNAKPVRSDASESDSIKPLDVARGAGTGISTQATRGIPTGGSAGRPQRPTTSPPPAASERNRGSIFRFNRK